MYLPLDVIDANCAPEVRESYLSRMRNARRRNKHQPSRRRWRNRPSAPVVTGISASVAADMARQFCDDLESRSYKESISRMAVRVASSKLSAADQDAILEYAAALRPKTIAGVAP